MTDEEKMRFLERMVTAGHIAYDAVSNCYQKTEAYKKKYQER